MTHHRQDCERPRSLIIIILRPTSSASWATRTREVRRPAALTIRASRPRPHAACRADECLLCDARRVADNFAVQKQTLPVRARPLSHPMSLSSPLPRPHRRIPRCLPRCRPSMLPPVRDAGAVGGRPPKAAATVETAAEVTEAVPAARRPTAPPPGRRQRHRGVGDGRRRRPRGPARARLHPHRSHPTFAPAPPTHSPPQRQHRHPHPHPHPYPYAARTSHFALGPSGRVHYLVCVVCLCILCATRRVACAN